MFYNQREIPRPIGCKRLMQYLSWALDWFSVILIFGPGGLGKTIASQYILKQRGYNLVYIRLPLPDKGTERYHNQVKSYLNCRFKVGLILDEVDCIGDYLGTRGWLLKMLDMSEKQSDLVIILITNRPWLIKKEWGLWRRIIEQGDKYYTDPPLTKEEMSDVLVGVAELTEKKLNLSEGELERKAEEMASEGWNFNSCRRLFKRLKGYTTITSEVLKREGESYRVEYGLPFAQENIDAYINDLHEIGISWVLKDQRKLHKSP